jgi:hypothetical protein
MRTAAHAPTTPIVLAAGGVALLAAAVASNVWTERRRARVLAAVARAADEERLWLALERCRVQDHRLDELTFMVDAARRMAVQSRSAEARALLHRLRAETAEVAEQIAGQLDEALVCAHPRWTDGTPA